MSLRAIRDDGAVVGLRGFVVLIGVVLYLTRVGVDTSVFSQIVGVVGVINFVDPSVINTNGLYAVVAQEGVLVVTEREGRAPRELVRRDVGRAQFDFEACVTHTTYVLQLAAEARRARDALVEEQVGRQTVVEVEGNTDTIEEAEVKTEVESLVLFPREVG